MYSFPNLELVHCSMPVLTIASRPAYRFLRRQVRWSVTSISLRIFHSFLVIHTVESFSVVNEAEVDFFFCLKCPCSFYCPMDVGNLISGSSTFSKTSLHIWNFSVHLLLKPSLKNLDGWDHKDHCSENLFDCSNFFSYGNSFLFFLPLKSINYHW